jgi:hypothetical protein
MKHILTLLIFISVSSLAKAQAWDLPWDLKAHDVGQLHGHVGFGAPRIDTKRFDKFSGEEAFNNVGAGPFFGRIEYGLSRKLSVSVGATYTNYKASWERSRPDLNQGITLPFEYGTIVNNIAIMSRLYYHMYTSVRWDVYSTGGIGYDLYKSEDYTKYTPDAPTFKTYFKTPPAATFDAGVGFRYFFLNRTAFYMEGGYGKSYGQLGFIVKIAQPKRNRIFN